MDSEDDEEVVKKRKQPRGDVPVNRLIKKFQDKLASNHKKTVMDMFSKIAIDIFYFPFRKKIVFLRVTMLSVNNADLRTYNITYNKENNKLSPMKPSSLLVL